MQQCTGQAKAGSEGVIFMFGRAVVWGLIAIYFCAGRYGWDSLSLVIYLQTPGCYHTVASIAPKDEKI